MVLVADAGNTNIKLGLFERERLLASARLMTGAPGGLTRELLSFLHEKKISPGDIGAAAVSAVVPKAGQAFLESARDLRIAPPLVVTSDTKTGIRIKTDVPAELGADRLVNAAAAFHYYGGPVLAVDFGTATTYDVVTEKGELLGGVIAPGVGICAEALWEKTAKLPKVAVEKPGSVLGTNTVSSMKSGIFYGYLGQLEYFIRRLKAELEADFKVVATGGLSRLFEGATTEIDVFDPDLTLKGLNYISMMHRQQTGATISS
ncbi:type III pantothenate kinase [Sporobacter termitidis DSM 10068]|uniref:Type III pantothenate kinase n=1 Tax=Sporobacter termitidis DSM 10068 TaxID=1123282 RepID=A0A1M5XSB1_9FIRM|nr:type III pantothenate kinase [Sporobacter termitidis]SHI02666.1 type III pantothenate kinase [Sporobacter termitidis DSM 10068]